jgi:murein hydrolase activator
VVEAASRAVRAAEPQLAAAVAAQLEQAAALDRMIAAAQAQRQQAANEAEQAARRAEEQATKAETLRGVLSTLEAQRKAEEAKAREEALQAERRKRTAEAEAARQREAALAKPVGLGSTAEPHGQLMAPVRGTVIRAWGEETDGGPATGVSYHAAPSAHVVSPCHGRVVFADRFRTYGLLLIVDCGGGYHAVVAGFDHLDVKVGQSVQAGEPVGVMPFWEAGGSGARPSLYVELRRDGQPINPAPWLKSNS